MGMCRWDIKKLLTRFGGPTVAHNLLNKHGIEGPSLTAIKNQHFRRHPTSELVACLILLGDKMGEPIKLESYITRER